MQKPRIKLFISYSDDDKNKVELIKRLLLNNPTFEAIIIAQTRRSLKPLTDKVMEGIELCDFVVPIITQRSISAQWLNQEIGYATAKEIEIAPVIENVIFKNLKGFIHPNLDLPYLYQSHVRLPQENKSFKICFLNLLTDLEQRNFQNQPKKTVKPLSSFKYLGWGNVQYSAQIDKLKCNWVKVDGKTILENIQIPSIKHINHVTSSTYFDKRINYLHGPAKEEYTAEIKADFDEDGNVSFYFVHTNRSTGKSHPSTNVNILDWNNMMKGIVIKPLRVKKNTPNALMSFQFI
jgi:hypothetical protein